MRLPHDKDPGCDQARDSWGIATKQILAMLFYVGVLLLGIVVFLAALGAAPPGLLLIASFVISSVCLREVSGWLIAAAMLASYFALANVLGLIHYMLERRQQRRDTST